MQSWKFYPDLDLAFAGRGSGEGGVGSPIQFGHQWTSKGKKVNGCVKIHIFTAILMEERYHEQGFLKVNVGEQVGGQESRARCKTMIVELVWWMSPWSSFNF